MGQEKLLVLPFSYKSYCYLFLLTSFLVIEKLSFLHLKQFIVNLLKLYLDVLYEESKY